MAVGAFSIGAVAIRRLAIQGVAVKAAAKFKSREIGELTVKKLRAVEIAVSDSLSLA